MIITGVQQHSVTLALDVLGAKALGEFLKQATRSKDYDKIVSGADYAMCLDGFKNVRTHHAIQQIIDVLTGVTDTFVVKKETGAPTDGAGADGATQQPRPN